MFDELSDHELLELIKQENLDALNELYSRYGRGIYSVAYKITKDANEAEEVTQDTFIKLWTNSKSFDIDKAPKVSSWLLKICQNAALDRVRKMKNKSKIVGESKLAFLTDYTVNLENEIEIHMLKKQIKEALMKLPQEQREIIELIYFEGLSQREIAEGMGIPLGTVKSRVKLAMVKLKKLLQKQVVEHG